MQHTIPASSRKISVAIDYGIPLAAVLFYAWDTSLHGWHVVHGMRYVAWLAVTWTYVLSDAWLARRSHRSSIAAIAALTAAPLLNLDGGGKMVRIVAWLAVVVIAGWFAAQAIRRQDVPLGISGLVGALWLYHLGLHNAFSMTSYSGFWWAETT